jgi:hypothetical protein
MTPDNIILAHGIVEDYPHGYQQTLRCPECIKNGKIEQ